jgi:hypothetical protein
VNAYPEGILAFSENSQSLCRIGFGEESSNNSDLSAASSAKQTQEFGFIGKVGNGHCRLPIANCRLVMLIADCR